jgi:hypothetical protein
LDKEPLQIKKEKASKEEETFPCNPIQNDETAPVQLSFLF